MPPLPAELVDLIMSSLHPIPLKHGNGDGNFLDRYTATVAGRLALVCRAWVPSSRRALFNRVHIKHSTAYTFAKLFYRVLRLTFLPFIRELEVFRKIAKHLPSSIPYPRALELACPSLRAITRLEIVIQYSSLAFAEVVVFLVSFPALEEVKIWLRDSSPWGDNDMRLPPTPPAVPESLRSLDIRYGPNIEPLLAWIETSGPPISTLTLSFTRHLQTHEPTKYALQYIQNLGSSLTSLTIAIDQDGFYPTRDTSPEADDPAPAARTISLLRKTHFSPVLHSVTIWAPAKLLNGDWPSNPPESLPWDDLDSMPPLNTVHRLHIVCFRDAVVTPKLQLDGQPTSRRSNLPLRVARGVVTEDVVHKPFPHLYRWNA
ncbi:hypothetical protein FB451DRAFT_1391630 [Mycena latifolia]|nr:hypothetical protein FB451DRAFT_1391630 [Mycena latifolia]